MALAVPTEIPIVAEPAAGPLVRVLSWTYRREDETLYCRLALTPDCTAYELKMGASSELFNDALSAFERQAAIDRSLIRTGFALAQFESKLESQR